MINNNIQNQPNFTSTYVPKTAKYGLLQATDKLEKYFEVKGFGDMAPQKIREKIDLGQAGIGLHKDGYTVVGKDREADEFIARQLCPESFHINYTQDTPETVFKGPVLDLNI